MNESAKPERLADEQALDAFLADHDVALVEAYTKGCSLCQAMEPVLGNVARASDIAVGMVNPGDDIGLVDRFDIRSVPTLLLFRDGDLVARRSEGFQGASDVLDFLAEHTETDIGVEA
ncbi:MAG: thioredoxin family protein [Halobacteriales archaeon]|nr:thioredoxin family protein [Halobacteriales archaeon]